MSVAHLAARPLEGKIALVTGAGRGIGAAVARRLAADGAAVVVNYARSEAPARAVVEAIRNAGGRSDAVRADLTQADGARELFAGLDAAFGGAFAGRLDVLVNNAGMAEWAKVHEGSAGDYLASFDRHFALNVRAVVAVTTEAARRMAAQKSGRIITIGSGLGERVPFGGGTIYSATKFAVNGLTRGWSRELGPLGITVNGVQPGPIDTDMNPADGAMADYQRSMTSVGRYGKPEEIAAAVAFLASPAAAFVNGENLTVDGGWNA